MGTNYSFSFGFVPFLSFFMGTKYHLKKQRGKVNFSVLFIQCFYVQTQPSTCNVSFTLTLNRVH